VLGTQLLSSTLPTIASNFEPKIGHHLSNPLVLQALTVLGAAPPALAKFANSAYFSSRGLTVSMRNGLLIYFGDASRPHAKWQSLSRVLADSTSSSATYVDVRLPERPAAGLREGAPATEGSGNAESTIATLAEGLRGKKESEAGGSAKGAIEGASEGTSEAGSEASGREGSEAKRREEAAGEAGSEPSEGAEPATEPSG
jgi:hypothetical protein